MYNHRSGFWFRGRFSTKRWKRRDAKDRCRKRLHSSPLSIMVVDRARFQSQSIFVYVPGVCAGGCSHLSPLVSHDEGKQSGTLSASIPKSWKGFHLPLQFTRGQAVVQRIDLSLDVCLLRPHCHWYCSNAIAMQ
jgi:hypothetical protein